MIYKTNGPLVTTLLHSQRYQGSLLVRLLKVWTKISDHIKNFRIFQF